MERQVMRLMAWERAKGELKSMLSTHVCEEEQYYRLKKAIEEFIKDIEGGSKHE